MWKISALLSCDDYMDNSIIIAQWFAPTRHSISDSYCVFWKIQMARKYNFKNVFTGLIYIQERSHKCTA